MTRSLPWRRADGSLSFESVGRGRGGTAYYRRVNYSGNELSGGTTGCLVNMFRTTRPQAMASQQRIAAIAFELVVSVTLSGAIFHDIQFAGIFVRCFLSATVRAVSKLRRPIPGCCWSMMTCLSRINCTYLELLGRSIVKPHSHYALRCVLTCFADNISRMYVDVVNTIASSASLPMLAFVLKCYPS